MLKYSVRIFFLHSLYLVLSILILWFWVNNAVLSAYNLQFTAFLVFSYFIYRFFKKNNSYSVSIFEIIILILILLLILSSTGGLGSPLFFLTYFLLFAVALLFDPPTTLTLTLTLALFFANTLNSIQSALQLLSLLFICPLAIYFGKQYLKLLESKEKIKILIKNEKYLFKKETQLEKQDAKQDEDSLIWLCLNFKDGLLKIIHQSADLLSDLSHLSIRQKDTLQSIHDNAKEVLKSGEKLREKIEKTD